MKIHVTIGLSDDLKSFLSKVFNVVEDPISREKIKAIHIAENYGTETPVVGLKNAKPNQTAEVDPDVPVIKKKKKVVVEESEELPKSKKVEKEAEEIGDLLGPVKPKKKTTKEDVVNKLQPIIDHEKGGFAKVQAALKKLGAASLVVLPEDKYDDLIKEVLGED